MARSVTPEQFDAILKRLGEVATERAPRIQISAMVKGLGVYKRRLFNEGRDSALSAIGRKASRSPKDKFAGDYTQYYYERYRQPRGVGDRKNLFVTGDNISRQIQVGTSDGGPAIGFVADSARLIAEGHEATHKKEIFSASDSEVDTIIDEYVDGVVDAISDTIKGIGDLHFSG